MWRCGNECLTRLHVSFLSSAISHYLNQIGIQSNLWSVCNSGQSLARFLAFSFSVVSTHHEVRDTLSDDHSRHVGIGADAVGHD